MGIVYGLVVACLGILLILFYPYLISLLFCLPAVVWGAVKDAKTSDFRLYGIYGYVGDVGSGKTITMVHELNKLRRKYGNDIYITTNFGYSFEDFPFSNFEELLVVRDKPLIVAWDEVQNEFAARDVAHFPLSLLTLLTQNRKSKGVRILYTCQHLSHIDKIFRDMTNGIYFCNTILGRFTYSLRARPLELKGTERPEHLLALGCTQCFIQTDRDRNSFDSFQILQSARNRGYGADEYIKDNIRDNNISRIADAFEELEL